MGDGRADAALARVVAVLAPFLLVASWAVGVLALPDPAVDGTTRAMGTDTESLPADPKVLVIGNSLAFRGIDRRILSRQLELGGDLGVLAYGASWAPTWYAALKNRVYAHGTEPRLVLVVSTLDFMLRADQPDGHRGEVYRALLTDDEPVLDAKVHGGRRLGGPVGEVWSRRGEVGRGWLSLIQAAPFAVWAEPEPRRAAEDALSAVFDAEGATDARLQRRVIPIVEQARRRRITDARASLVPDLVALAAAHGSRIVFARIPMSRAGREEYPLPPLAVEREAVELMNELGAGYVDLHALPLPDSAYLDGKHLNRQGAATYTEALARALVELDALGDGPFPPARLPARPPTVTRAGQPPAPPAPGPRVVEGCRVRLPLDGLDALSDDRLERLGVGPVSPIEVTEDREPLPHGAIGEACDGVARVEADAVAVASAAEDPARARYRVTWSEDLPLLPAAATAEPAWWVYPGTRLELAFDPDDAVVGPTAVEVVGLLIGEGAPPTLSVDGAVGPARAAGIRWVAGHAGASPPRSVVVEAPVDGAWVLVRSVVLRGQGDAVHEVLGSVAESSTTAWLVGGSSPATVTAAVPEPEVAIGDPHRPDQRGGAWSFDLPQYAWVSFEALRRRTGVREDLPEDDPDRITGIDTIRRCSPLRVAQDGEELKRTLDRTVIDLGPARGIFLHSTDHLWVRPKLRGLPTATWTASLAAQRQCDRYLWVYPGDALEISRPEALGRLHAGADRLVVGGLVFGPRDQDHPVRVEVLVDGRPLLDEAISMARLERETPALALPARVPAVPDDVVVRVSTSPDAPFFLLNAVALSEAP